MKRYIIILLGILLIGCQSQPQQSDSESEDVSMSNIGSSPKSMLFGFGNEDTATESLFKSAELLVGCGNRQVKQETTTQSIETEITDSIHEYKDKETDIEVLQDSTSNIAGGESLNDIRFGNWTDNDWYDNDYFRALREYLDFCYQGKIVNENLEPYKSALKERFVILNAEPFISGGMFVTIIFLEAPNKIFDAAIYSTVNKNTKTVIDYRVIGIRALKDVESGLTKNDILTIIKEHPENKLW